MNSLRRYNLDIFPQNNHISYYILGAFITDGCINKNNTLEFSSSDEEWIKTIATTISKDINVGEKITHIGTKTYRFSVQEKSIINWLNTNQCVNNKSLTVKFPDIPNEHLGSFLRGCLDGDGCISFKEKKSSPTRRKTLVAYICGSSFDFLKSIQENLSKIDIKSNLRNQNLPKKC